MNGKYFIDTSIFIRTFDRSDKTRQDKAKEIVSHALDNLTGITSSQVIHEFLLAATTLFKIPISLADCHKYMTFVLEPLCEVYANIHLYHQSLEMMERWKFSLVNSMIISAALKAECNTLYTEDLPHFTKIQNLTIINPFLTEHDRHMDYAGR
ncbi:MAG TPA: PIN domain-containing protein [bacterium]|nr:PIN domain-containing protein [bacterium]HPN43813.1 PIN domain-containing protein [bacterium]